MSDDEFKEPDETPDEPPRDFKLYPAWRQVQAELIAGGLSDGSIITDEYLMQAFGLQPPTTIAEAERNRGLFNFQAGQLRDGLLRDNCIMLQRVPNIGYVVIPPGEQTSVAMRDGSADIMRAFERAAAQVHYVRVDALTEDERKENANAAAKLGALGTILRKRLALKGSDDSPRLSNNKGDDDAATA
jgi:hypothetical protein